MNAYEILGVKPSDDKAVIKQAYKKLANKHHPDKGGDVEKFKQIQQAYDDIKDGTATDPMKRSYTFKNRDDIFNFFQNQQTIRPQHFIRVKANITVPNAVNGGMQVLEIVMVPGHTPQYINIEVPAGVVEGETINYPKKILHKTDVHVTFHIVPDKIWSINGLDVTKEETFDFWELILGTTRNIKTIANDTIKITIPPMTKPGTLMKIAKKGATNRQNYLLKGAMYVKIQSKLPDIISKELIKEIKLIVTK